MIDIGSSVSLINSKLKTYILTNRSNFAKPPTIKLCGAGDKELTKDGYYSLEISLNGRKPFHYCMFINQLQVPCILGMDFLAKAGVVIDTQSNKILLSDKPNPISPVKLTLTNPKQLTLAANLENAINLPCEMNFP